MMQNLAFYELSATCQIPKLSTIYEQYFGRINDGCFAEVGAFDGEFASNTSGLADIGWHGFYIEPVSEYFFRCKHRHGRNANTKVSKCAIGSRNCKVEVQIGGPFSTTSRNMRDNFKDIDWAKRAFIERSEAVDQITLEEYLSFNGIKENFELLIIDVEGNEWDVIRNFDIRKWRPQMVIIELYDQNDDFLIIREECNNIVNYFYNNGYKVIYKDFVNTIYVPLESYPFSKEL